MKSYIRIVILSIFMSSGISCTYQRPLLSIRISSEIVTDTIKHVTKKRCNYNYWGVKRPTHIGGYSKVVKSDSLRNKIEVHHWKKNPLYMQDANVRYYTKTVYYKRAGEKEKITNRIFQSQGVGGYVALNETIYFENGKKIQKGSQLKRKRNNLY